MKIATRLLWTGIGMGLGYVIGRSIGETEEEKRKNSFKGLLIGGGASFGLTFLIEPKKDTMNYALEHKGKRVYDGITKEHRIDIRPSEHERDGKVFDTVKIDNVTRTREDALRIERYRIRRNEGKYNIHHNQVA